MTSAVAPSDLSSLTVPSFYKAPDSLQIVAIGCVPVFGAIWSLFEQRKVNGMFDFKSKEVSYGLIQEKNRIKLMTALGSLIQCVAILAFHIFTHTPIGRVALYLYAFAAGIGSASFGTYVANKIMYSGPKDINMFANLVM